MDSRSRIRQQLRQQRRGLSPAEQKQAAHSLCRQLVTSPLFLRSQRIACYFANDGEIDLQPVINRIWRMGKECYLPILGGLAHNRLDFVRYLRGEALLANRYNILEPEARHQSVPPWAIDLVLLPLVAFDIYGNRLGMGGGYYDRTLSYLRWRRWWRTPCLIGVAHDFQQIETLPSEAWDIPLNGVVTESGVMLFAIKKRP